MKEVYFNNIVKKILKSKWKVINSEKIKKNISDIMDKKYSDKKAYKMIYYLKNKGYIISLKKDIYYITSPESKLDQEKLIDKFYRQILKENCKYYLDNDRYIWWIKWLELNISNYDIPEYIDIINSYKQSKEVVLIWKFINFKKYSIKDENLFKKFKQFTHKIKIWKNIFLIADIELAILESLYNPNILTWNYCQELIKKILRKNKKNINFDKIAQIIKLWKHHSSINRLYKISKSIWDNTPKTLSEIIKKFSFFLEL